MTNPLGFLISKLMDSSGGGTWFRLNVADRGAMDRRTDDDW
jgi:hypothetical protein